MEKKKIKSHWNERWLKLETEYPTRAVNYYISDYGRIKVVNKLTGSERLIKGSKLKWGSISLNIKLEGNRNKSFHVHKFVALNFVEREEESKKFVMHKDGDKTNNHYKNLEWLTRAELTERLRERGDYSIEKLKEKGMEIKMTESKVKMLKKRLKEGKTKRKILAKQFGITMTQLKRIESGENWSQVKLDEEEREVRIRVEI